MTRVVRDGRGAEAAYERAAADAYARTPRAWLWRVEGCGATAPSFLLGTMHVGVRFSDAVPPPLAVQATAGVVVVPLLHVAVAVNWAAIPVWSVTVLG